MPFDFPTTPTEGQQFTPAGGPKYIYYNPAWQIAPPAAVGASPSNAIPLMDGTGAAGVSALYSRGDHVHPTDTSRAAASHTHAYSSLTGIPATFAPSAHSHTITELNAWAATGPFFPVPSSGGMAAATGNTAGLEIKSAAGSAAMLAFHRPAAFAAFLGIDTDNILKYGGWSVGNVAHTIWHAGNLNPGAYMPVAGGTFSGAVAVNGTFTAAGNLWVTSGIQCNTATLIIGGAGGHLYFRPHGTGNATTEYVLLNDGNGVFPAKITAPYHTSTAWVYGGFQCKNTGGGDTSGNIFNMLWDGVGMVLFVDNTNIGYANNGASDYRIKKDVEDLPGMWETLKKYRPIKYTLQEWWPTPMPSGKDRSGEPEPVTEPLIKVDDLERWGFIAHELQEATIPSAASGVKDAANTLQTPDQLTILAVTVKTLQEAQARIETMQARIDALEA